MRSTPVRCRSRRPPPLFAAAALTLAGLSACDAPPEVQESVGAVQPWTGTPDSSTPELTFQAFTDETARRSTVETHALITSAAGYTDYFGHAPPSGVDFRREWVIFYAAGTRPTGGYKADVQSIGVKGDTLYAVTVLQTPGLCPVTQALTSPSVMVKFPAQKTRGVIFQHREVSATCGPQPQSCEALDCKPGSHCVLSKSNPPRAECIADEPATNPCAVILCKPGSHCVLSKSNPPRAECIADEPVTNPCAVILCAAGQQCVVLESYPPQARCVPVDQPTACASSSQCKDGLVCSTEQGVCGANPSCATSPKSTCDTACWGTCVKKAEPQPMRCTSSQNCAPGQRCSTERGDCLSCGDPKGAANLAPCPAVCFGVCETAPVAACTTSLLKGNCRTADLLKAEAAEACKAQGMLLTDFGTGQACFASGFVEAKYSCCPVR